jgi:glycosyltransferase involved in cell wall biosynthesis
MKTLHLSTSDIDNGGARAAYRLHKGLQGIGCESQMLVRAKFSSDPTVLVARSLLTKLGPPSSDLPLRFYPKCTSEMFSAQWFPDGIGTKAAQQASDIINLHWICNGFIQIETLAKFNRPLVWTLHDMWPFTGGCHYTRDCTQYQASCGTCPQLPSRRRWDLSRWIWQRKKKAIAKAPLTIVATSRWMADCARASSLFKDLPIEVIPLGLDTQRYKPINRQVARELLNLPQDKQLVLFGAIGATANPRKGFHLLLPALQQLCQEGWGNRLGIVVFGGAPDQNPIPVELESHYVGYVHDDLLLTAIYAAADVMVVPSVQEVFGQTAIESMACGTPVIAFNGTGLQDIVTHQETGYLAQPFEVQDLARGIAWVLAEPERHKTLCLKARETCVTQFSAPIQAERYLSLYKEILRD